MTISKNGSPSSGAAEPSSDPEQARSRAVSPLRQRMIGDMELAGLSPKTQLCYLGAVVALQRHTDTRPDRLTEEQVYQYVLWLRDTKGVSVMIYDQVCATEKRRRSKRGLREPDRVRVIINQEVCEGCGDCSIKSNCLSVEPVETELGRKRRINLLPLADIAAATSDLGYVPTTSFEEGLRQTLAWMRTA